jgi:protein-L-isoaspartate(D-aspartate) O-methyltransferase
MQKGSLRFVARRKALVDLLRKKGIRSERVLAVIGSVPRECFMDPTFVELSYEDKAFPIGSGQTISQPYTVAWQTELLELNGGEKVLEIGTGSGYQSAVLAELGVQLFSIERQRKLYERTKVLLASLDCPVCCAYGDGYQGWRLEAPFDRILVTAGSVELPEKLLSQLTIGGVMVIPLQKDGELDMCRIRKTGEDSFQTEYLGKCSFVPMLEGVED